MRDILPHSNEIEVEQFMKSRSILIGVGVLCLAFGKPVMAQDDPLQAHVAALKANLAQSQQNLRAYEWIETTVISLDGEEKSRQQNRCYYAADGVLQKVPVTAPPPEQGGRGLRGRIAENKKEELTEYMQQAVGLVGQYVPPDPARIQATKDAGKVSMQMTDPGKVMRLVFADYIKPGDSLALDLDLQANRLLGVEVSTFDSENEPVALHVSFAALPDGTSYAAETSLDAPAEDLNVTITNSGYRKMGS
jgi:hypothetical protein